MKAFLTRGWLLIAIGLGLIGLFIWYAGPYFAFGDYRPLDTEFARYVAIGVVVLAYAAYVIVKRLRAARATDRLMAGVARSATTDKNQPSAEAMALRERFEQAAATLKQAHRSLYDLPWYVFIGAPGSGKTTALVNSGLKFPLEQRLGKGPVGGVGGTRNCTWWFTDEAVFLDTAGRYTTQDSDPTSDSAAWKEFLGLLRQYRRRRPLNGVILTMSASDLMTLNADGREAYVAAARRRLDELNRELRVKLPVYVMVTKADLVAGFEEYFADQAADGRAQVWGVTFPYEQTMRGDAAKSFASEFDALMLRLNQRVFARISEENDPRRRTKIFAFPQQMAHLRDLLDESIREVFGTTRFDRQILLRGVYFTSGTQEGTPIDRLLSAIGRRFQVAPDAVLPGSRGKAYFIERLLKDVLIGESGVAGVNWKIEVRQAAAQLAAYAAMAAIAVLGVVLLSVSYAKNQGYLRQVSQAVTTLDATQPVVAGASLNAVLPRLDAVSKVVDVANQYRARTPWSMTWGLFQGKTIGNAATNAYALELHDGLLPHLKDRIERRMAQYAADPDRLYEYLKAYLMLGDPQHLDKTHLGAVADLEWNSDLQPDMAAALSHHFKNLLAAGQTLGSTPLNASLVAQARATIRQASVPKLVYSRLKLLHTDDDPSRGVRLDEASGIGSERVLRRRSNRKLSDPVPYMYTAAGFKDVTSTGTSELVKQFNEDSWVWGERGVPVGDSTALGVQVMDLYEQDYIAQWDGILGDVKLNASTPDDLAIVASPTGSPLRGFLATVDANTFLVKPPDPSAPASSGGMTEAARKTLNKLFTSGRGGATSVPAAVPGAAVTAHFASIHRLFAGSPPAIDSVISGLQNLRQQTLNLGSGAGKTGGMDALNNQQLSAQITSLLQDAQLLPPEVRNLVKQVGENTAAAVKTVAATELHSQYEALRRDCSAVIDGRYPFNSTSATEVPLQDFGRVFGYGGLFDNFFKANLEKMVDTNRSPWALRAGAVGVSPEMLRKFEDAEQIRRMFFQPGSSSPQVTFTLIPGDLDSRTANLKLTINGKKYEYKQGQQTNFRPVWPGDGGGQVVVSFDGGMLSRVDTKTFDGPWALFRFVDFGVPTRETAERMMLHLELSGHRVGVRLDADRIDNPFTNRSWLQFRCGS